LVANKKKKPWKYANPEDLIPEASPDEVRQMCEKAYREVGLEFKAEEAPNQIPS
jgi:hypothetical protein